MKLVLRGCLLLIAAAVIALVLRTALLNANTPTAPAKPERVPVRVAATELPPGRLLRDSEMNWQDMAVNQVPKGAITRNETDKLAQLKGALVRHPLAAGAPIRLEDVIAADTPGFLAAALKPGMRAISVPITDVSGNSGLIQPGDFIDLILTQSMREASPGQAVVSETIATGLRVIAVGSTIARPKDADSANTRASTASLEVSPRAAEIITVAARMGELSLALRSFANEGREGAPTEEIPPARGMTWAGDISQAARAATPPRSERASQSSGGLSTGNAAGVVILRGSKRDNQTGVPTGLAGLLVPAPATAPVPPPQ